MPYCRRENSNRAARRGERPANPIFRSRCRYCGAVGWVRYMVILANGQWRKTGPFCADEEACWQSRHPPTRAAARLEDIHGE